MIPQLPDERKYWQQSPDGIHYQTLIHENVLSCIRNKPHEMFQPRQLCISRESYVMRHSLMSFTSPVKLFHNGCLSGFQILFHVNHLRKHGKGDSKVVLHKVQNLRLAVRLLHPKLVAGECHHLPNRRRSREVIHKSIHVTLCSWFKCTMDWMALCCVSSIPWVQIQERETSGTKTSEA